MVFYYGYYNVLELLIGMICPIGTTYCTKHVIIEDFSNGYVLVGYLKGFFIQWQQIYINALD
jgi:hypothetical protein